MKFGRRNREPTVEREPVFPIHCYSAGMCGTPREPLTWFRCTECGRTTVGSPYKLPPHGCFGHEPGRMAEGEWVVADAHEAFAGTVKALDGRTDLVARVWASR